MMSMPKWVFEDDCLAPERKITLNFVGKNPFKICRQITDIFIKVFEASTTQIRERDFRWDMTSDPRNFYMRIYVVKGVDAHTSMTVGAIIQGKQPVDENKPGSVSISIEGKLRTEFNLNTAFKKTPIYKGLREFYNFVFYNEVRRKYIYMCNELINKFAEEIRAVYGMPSALGG